MLQLGLNTFLNIVRILFILKGNSIKGRYSKLIPQWTQKISGDTFPLYSYQLAVGFTCKNNLFQFSLYSAWGATQKRWFSMRGITFRVSSAVSIREITFRNCKALRGLHFTMSYWIPECHSRYADHFIIRGGKPGLNSPYRWVNPATASANAESTRETILQLLIILTNIQKIIHLVNC